MAGAKRKLFLNCSELFCSLYVSFSCAVKVGRGYVRGVTFEDIKFYSVQNPIIIDQNYCHIRGACEEKVSYQRTFSFCLHLEKNEKETRQ